MALQDYKIFTNKWWPVIVNITAGSGIFPETMLAQMIVESSTSDPTKGTLPGQNPNAIYANNYFGIKADESWAGPVYSSTTWEFMNGSNHLFVGTFLKYNSRAEAILKGANPVTLFRAYSSIEDSMRDHIKVLHQPNFVEAGVLRATNYVDQLKALKAGGYATAPDYVSTGVSIISYLTDLIKKKDVPSLQPLELSELSSLSMKPLDSVIQTINPINTTNT